MRVFLCHGAPWYTVAHVCCALHIPRCGCNEVDLESVEGKSGCTQLQALHEAVDKFRELLYASGCHGGERHINQGRNGTLYASDKILVAPLFVYTAFSACSTSSKAPGSSMSTPAASASICLTGPVNHLRAHRNQLPKVHNATMPTATGV